MDGTRPRRMRDQARRNWYALYRQWRFARWLGFQQPTLIPIPVRSSDGRTRRS